MRRLQNTDDGQIIIIEGFCWMDVSLCVVGPLPRLESKDIQTS